MTRLVAARLKGLSHFSVNKILLSVVLFLSTAGTGFGAANYDQFVVAIDGAHLKQLLEDSTTYHIALSNPTTYVVPNTNGPILINKSGGPVYIHGLDRRNVKLSPSNPANALFRFVTVGGKISLSNFAFTYHASSPNNWSPIEFASTLPTNLEFEAYDLFTGGVQFEINRAGTYRFQGVVFNTLGRVQTAVNVNHGNANVIIVGGNNYSTGTPPGEYHHFWQKLGRLQIYGMSLQTNKGDGDIKIETRAPNDKAHILAYVRSEGSADLGVPSKLLTVPSTNEQVDILMAGCSLTKAVYTDRAISMLAEYNARGKLWMYNNVSAYTSLKIVKGQAPSAGAKIIAVGNYIGSNVSLPNDTPTSIPIDVNANNVSGLSYNPALPQSTLIYGANMWLLADANTPGDPYGCYYAQKPCIRNIKYSGSKENISVGANFVDAFPPSLEVPNSIVKPALNGPFPTHNDIWVNYPTRKMHNIKVLYPNIGTGGDDTQSIQAALNTYNYLYFPVGTYNVNWDSLGSQTTNAAINLTRTKTWGPGGWIAGAGKANTVIRRRHSDKGTVFEINGLGYATISGLTFESTPYNFSQPSTAIQVPAFKMDYPGGNRENVQEIMFHDVAFDGGREALSVSPNQYWNCAENMYNYSSFKNAKQGVIIGNTNAYMNIVQNSTFTNVGTVIGHSLDVPRRGGTHGVFNSTATGVSGPIFNYREATEASYAYYNFSADGPSMFARDATSARFGIYFDTVQFPNTGTNMIDTWAATSVGFRNSTVGGTVKLVGDQNVNMVVRMGGTTPTLSSATSDSTFIAFNSPTPTPTPIPGPSCGLTGTLNSTGNCSSGQTSNFSFTSGSVKVTNSCYFYSGSGTVSGDLRTSSFGLVQNFTCYSGGGSSYPSPATYILNTPGTYNLVSYTANCSSGSGMGSLSVQCYAPTPTPTPTVTPTSTPTPTPTPPAGPSCQDLNWTTEYFNYGFPGYGSNEWGCDMSGYPSDGATCNSELLEESPMPFMIEFPDIIMIQPQANPSCICRANPDWAGCQFSLTWSGATCGVQSGYWTFYDCY